MMAEQKSKYFDYTTIVLNVRTHGKMQEYWWVDNLGLHQYFCNTEVEVIEDTIKDFRHEIIDNDNTYTHLVYSWTDNLGFHQYHNNLY
jgi:hypothetical protein